MKAKKGFFWDSYCYSFKEEERQPDDPRNLCRYFWRGVCGMIHRGRDAITAWFEQLSILRSFCYSFLLIGICIGFMHTLEKLDALPPIKEGPPWWFLPNMMVMMTGILFLFVALGKIAYRAYKMLVSWTGEKVIEIGGVACLILIFTSLIVFALFSSVDTGESALRVLYFFAILFGSMVGGVILIILGALFCVALSNWSATADFVKTTVQYLKAIKARVCPMVEPPDSFEKAKE